MRTRNKIIKEVTQCAEANGWHVDAEKHQDKNIVIFEFSQFIPAGQDFFFSVTMQGRSLESLITDMEEYYEGFDVDSEAYLWLDSNGHGKNGAPYRMKDVLADMEAAEDMVCKLLEAVSPFTPFLGKAGSLIGNQVITTELYSLIVLHPEKRQRPFRMGDVIIDSTPVYAEVTRRFAH